MPLLGLDLNASRARAVRGPAGAVPRAMTLENDRRELHLAVSLEGRKPALGRAGVEISRKSPHLVCRNFLSRLGEDRPFVWKAGRHSLDAAAATKLLFDRLASASWGVQG